MRGHAIADIDDRVRAVEEHRQEIQGRLPKGPYEFAKDLTFDDVKPADDDSPTVRRFKLAVRRDARWGSARHGHLQAFGFSQALRSIYDGGRQLIDGGAS